MKILYLAIKDDYGDPKRGYSIEHYTFYDTLKALGHQIIYFDFYQKLKQFGSKAKRDRQLLNIVTKETPQLLFSVISLYDDFIAPEIISQISEQTNTTTFNWFSDDASKFWRLSQHWAPVFNWVSTTETRALPWYKKIGHSNVVLIPWAVNPHYIKPLKLSKKYDVTFIGQPHSHRKNMITKIRQAGIKVHCWGHGWENGRLSQQDMNRVFNQSTINLNFTATAYQGKGLIASLRHRGLIPLNTQMKARLFEVPGSSNFLLTETTPDLPLYYHSGTEIETFKNAPELINKIKHFLSQEVERRKISQAGYRRTIKEHTYQQRLTKILQTIKFKS